MNQPNELTDAAALELEVLCNALEDGSITDTQRHDLEERIVSQPAARAYYVRFAGLAASLREYAGESQSDIISFPKRTAATHWWLWGSIAAAAVLIFTMWPNRPVEPNSTITIAETEEALTDGVAMLAAGENCLWKQGRVLPGQSFRAGETLELLTGFAEIVFDCGARVLLQGPTTIELTSAWETALRKGTLRATVPQEAIGFKVSNPEVDIVDLGTDFSVVTDDHGESEVFVHQGAIEVHEKPKKPTGDRPKKAVLREKESRRFAKNGTSLVRDEERKFQDLGRKVALPRDLKPSQVKQWSWKPDQTTDLMPLTDRPFAFVQRHGHSMLQFDGTTGAQLTTPQWTQDQARTIAFWVRIPVDSPLADAPPFVSWRPHSKMLSIVEIGANDDPAMGVVGAVSVRLGNRKLVGTKPLRDGDWHHIALVLVRQQKEKGVAEMHPKFFVDGKLEARSGKGPVKRPRTKHSPPIGAGFFLASGIDDSLGEFFVGDFGSLVFADGAMSQQEIRQLMADKL